MRFCCFLYALTIVTPIVTLPLPLHSTSIPILFVRPPPSRRGLLPQTYKVKSWSELVKGALVAGVSASVGRIAMQEWLNRTYGPKTSYGVTPKPPPCTCDLNEVAEDETLLDEAIQLKSSLAPTGANEIPAVAPTETNVTLANISTNDLQNSTALVSSSISRTSTLKPVRSLARRFMTETEILGWEKLVSVALNVGVSASVGRIVMQEFLNRRWGPRDSWGDRPQSFITCDCQALVKLNVTAEDYRNPSLTSYIW